MINLNQLRVFYHAAKYQSCSQAAKDLSITQPAVTNQIRALERDYELKLFKKKGRGILLTEEGKTLFEMARKIFEYEIELESAMKELGKLGRGVLRVGSTKTYARAFMPLIFSLFHESFPNIEVHLNEGSSMDILQDLVDLKIEVAFIGKVMSIPEIEFRTFCREDIFLIVGPSHAFANRETVAFEEMAREPIIMRDKGSATRRFVDEIFSSRHCKPNILLVSENIEFIKNIVSRGRGITFLSNEATSNELKEKKLIAVPIEGHFYSIDQVIAHLRDQPLSPNCRAFIECIVHKFLKDGEPFKSLSEARAVIRKMRKKRAQE